MPLPPKHWLDTLDALKGAPKVTHPHGGTAYPRIERTFVCPIGQEALQPATLTAYAGSVLVQLEEISRDNIRVNLYVRYDTLPGPILTSRMLSDGAQGERVAASRQSLAASAAVYSPTWRDLSWADTATDVSTKQRAIVTLDAPGGSVAEVTRVVTTGLTPLLLAGTRFNLEDENGPVYVWANVNGLSTDPAPFGRRGIAYALSNAVPQITTVSLLGATPAGLANKYVTGADDTAAVYGWWNLDGTGVDPTPGGRGIPIPILSAHTDVQLAAATKSAFDADSKFSAAVDPYVLTTVAITDASNGTRTASTAGNSGLPVANTQTGVTTTTSASGIATAINTAVNPDAGFNSTVSTNTVTITAATAGPRTDADAGDSGLAVTTITQGQLANAFPPRTEYDQDPKTGSLITTIYQVVEAAAVVPPTAIHGRRTQYRSLDVWRSLKVITAYSTPVGSFTEQRFDAHSFKECLISFLAIDGCGVFSTKEAGDSLLVNARLVTSYGAFQEVIGMKIFANSFRLGNFNETNILNDAGCLTMTGSCVATMNIRASSPTASEYLALFTDTYRLISGECVDWHGVGIFETSKLYVYFPRKPVVNDGTC